MPDRSAAASAADAAAAPAAGAGAGADRLVRRKLTDALGLGRSLYAASPAVLKAGLDNLAWLSAPVVSKVVNKVNPLAQGLVDRLDDGVDTVTAKLASANTTAQAAGADLKFAASQSLELVSKQWHASVDSILVPLHPTLAANVYFTQAVEQFKQLFAAAQAQVQSASASASASPSADAKSLSSDASDAAAAGVTVQVFVARVKQQLAALWDDRLVPLTEAFYEAARARYTAGAKSADEALTALKQALGAAWNQQVLQVFASRVGEPSREVYNKVLSKFVHFWDSKTGDTASIASGPAFVSAMKGALGGLWTDRLREPVLELYEAIKAQSLKNAQTLRDLAARAQRDTDAADAAAAAAAAHGSTGAAPGGAVVSLFTALQTQALTQLSSLQTLLASAQQRAKTEAEALSHWSLRRLYSTGQGLVHAAYDQTVTRAVNGSLQLSAVTLDYLLPRAEGEELNPSSAAKAAAAATPAPAPAADAKAPAQPAGPTAGANNALTLRVLRDRASARVRARVQRAVAGAKKAVTRSDALAERTAQQLQPYVGVNVYAESKEFLNRTQQLLSSIQSFAVETKAQSDKNSAAVQATVKAAALARVRTALTAVNDEFAKHSRAVQALLQKLDTKTGAVASGAYGAVASRTVTVRDAVTAKSKTAAAAIRARLAIAVQKLQSLAAKSREMTDYVLDREIAQLPQDLLRLLRVLPTLLPQQLFSAGEQVHGAAAKAGAKASNGLRSLLNALSEAVKAVAAYTAAVAGRVRGVRASSQASATATAAAASSSSSASTSAASASPSASSTEAAAGTGAGATLSPVPSSASLSLTPNNGSPQLANAVLSPATASASADTAAAAGAAPAAPTAAPTAAGAASPVKVIAAAYDSLAAQQAAEAAAAVQPVQTQSQSQSQRSKQPVPAAKRSKRNRRAVAAADEETVKSADDQPAAADD